MARALLYAGPEEGRTMSLASWAAKVALVVGGTYFAMGCSHATESASVGFALPSTTAAIAGARPIEVKSVRVLATRVDLRQPIFVQRGERGIDVTYAVRQRDGVTMHLDARTLRSIEEPSAYLYPRCSARDVSAHLVRDVARVALEGGEEVVVFTSDEHSRAFARAGEGPAFVVSPEGMHIVGPARASASGRDVVAVFIAATEDGFALVATSLEPTGDR
jgi:hypothetical protein